MIKENKSKGIIISSILMLFPASMYFVTAHKHTEDVENSRTVDISAQQLVKTTYDNLVNKIDKQIDQHHELRSQAISVVPFGGEILVSGEVESVPLKKELALLIEEIQVKHPTSDIINNVVIQ